MAQYYGDKFGIIQTDEHGNSIAQTDEYGNPIHRTTGTDEYGKYSSGTGTGAISGPYPSGEQHHGLSAMLQRSSSSEDDGIGGRRKKGLKEKIKEKMPGSHSGDKAHYTASTATPNTTPALGHGLGHEKKGIMGKIMDKLPGTHHHH